MNTYTDTKKIFNFLHKKIIRGGILVFDDFGIWGVDGIKKIVYEIEKNIRPNTILLKITWVNVYL